MIVITSRLINRLLTPYIQNTIRCSHELLTDIQSRGIIENVFPDTSDTYKLLGKQSLVLYAGFDPTAPSLHIGNLSVLNLLMKYHAAGHSIIALIGDATARIGDPSGKSKERPLLKSNDIIENAGKIEQQIRNLFENHNRFFNANTAVLPDTFRVVHNFDWWKDINLLDFLTVCGREMRMGALLSRTSVKSRLLSSEGISLTEFLYQCLQSYDWFHLLREYNCLVQVGGEDQMGNMKCGYELISKKTRDKCCCILVPLITSEAGDKYGKTGGNAIWLDECMTTPYELYQFLLRTRDDQVQNLLNKLTFLTKEEIMKIMANIGGIEGSETPQQVLAKQITLLVHGDEGVHRAVRMTEVMHSRDPATLQNLTDRDINELARLPFTSHMVYSPGKKFLDLALEAKCFMSKGDAIRIMTAGGFKVNNQLLRDPEQCLEEIHVLPSKSTFLKVGKKHNYVIKWQLLDQ